MSDGDALLAAIRDRPDDDTPRLVYADWLDDMGETARAAFIRVQIELARGAKHNHKHRDFGGPPGGCRACKLHRAACRWVEADEGGKAAYRAVIPGQGDLWYGGHGLAGQSVGIDFARGFVEAVTCCAADWLAHGDTILAAHPVRSVRLTTWPTWERHPTYGDSGYARLPGREKIVSMGCVVGSPDDTPLVRKLLAAEWPGVAFELPPPAPNWMEEMRRVSRELMGVAQRYAEADFAPILDTARSFGEAATAVGRALIPTVARIGELLRPVAEALPNTPEFIAALETQDHDADPTAP